MSALNDDKGEVYFPFKIFLNDDETNLTGKTSKTGQHLDDSRRRQRSNSRRRSMRSKELYELLPEPPFSRTNFSADNDTGKCGTKLSSHSRDKSRKSMSNSRNKKIFFPSLQSRGVTPRHIKDSAAKEKPPKNDKDLVPRQKSQRGRYFRRQKSERYPRRSDNLRVEKSEKCVETKQNLSRAKSERNIAIESREYSKQKSRMSLGTIKREYPRQKSERSLSFMKAYREKKQAYLETSSSSASIGKRVRATEAAIKSHNLESYQPNLGSNHRSTRNMREGKSTAIHRRFDSTAEMNDFLSLPSSSESKLFSPSLLRSSRCSKDLQTECRRTFWLNRGTSRKKKNNSCNILESNQPKYEVFSGKEQQNTNAGLNKLCNMLAATMKATEPVINVVNAQTAVDNKSTDANFDDDITFYAEVEFPIDAHDNVSVLSFDDTTEQIGRLS